MDNPIRIEKSNFDKVEDMVCSLIEVYNNIHNTTYCYLWVSSDPKRGCYGVKIGRGDVINYLRKTPEDEPLVLITIDRLTELYNEICIK